MSLNRYRSSWSSDIEQLLHPTPCPNAPVKLAQHVTNNRQGMPSSSPSSIITKYPSHQTRLAYSRAWHHISLSSPNTPPLGRLASQIAIVLMGKHKPIWDPSTDCGDYVVATNCTDVYATGKKMQQKLYYKQTTRPGALKSLNMEGMIRKWGGGEVLKRAVSGMLPKNRLRKPRLERLKGELYS